MKFTQEQRTAIEARNTSLLLSAAAGSGKTTVLVERIIQMVTSKDEPVDVDRILVVTFTKAAAASMREKLHRELKRLAAANPSDRHLKRQLLALQNASIGTVHSFCSEVVRNNLHLLGGAAPANYRLLTESEGELLKYRAANQVLEAYYEASDSAFEQVVEAYSSNKNDDRLLNIILDIYRFIVSLPYYEKWFDDCFSYFEEVLSGEENRYMALACKHTGSLFSSFADNYQHLLPFEEEKHAGRMKKELASFARIIELAHGGRYFELAETVNALQIEKPKKDSYREFAAKQIEALKSDFFCHTGEHLREDVEKTLPLIQKIVEIVKRFDQTFHQMKLEQNALDFNDLEHLAVRVLSRQKEGGQVPTEAAFSYREKFVEVLVDEYQDTNDVQEAIFRMVSRDERNLFAVGDVKQSIYRFRQANPDIFLNRSGGNAKRDWAKTIYLTQNFRCRENIVNFINFLFDDIMEERISSIPYRKTERLRLGADYFPPIKPELYGAEVLLCHRERKETAQVERGESEGILIAQRIRRLMEDEGFLIQDGGERRRLRYKDIAILVRGVSEQTRLLADTLVKNHIPVSFSQKKPLLDTPEVKGLFAFLEVLDNPYHDVPMIAVLKLFFHLDNQQLLQLRLRGKNKHFYDLLGEGGYEETIGKLANWRRESFYKTVYELLQDILRDTRYLAIQTACPNGMEKRSNLLAFIELARRFEEDGFRGLSDFVVFIRGMMDSPAQDKNEMPMDEDRDAVRIMTIHKSKGLEFPVVILAHAGKKVNSQDLNKVLLFHRDYGIGFDYVDVKRRFQYPTLMKNAVKLKVRLEQTAEELRLLYVALTRAREKLIITGDVQFMSSSLNRWNRCVENPSHRIGYDGLYTGTCYLDFLIPPLLRCEAFRDINRSGEGIETVNFTVNFQDYTYTELEAFKTETLVSEEEKRETLLTPAEGFDLDTLCDISYPFKREGLPRKISVSEVRRIQTGDPSLAAFPISLYTPVFLKDDLPQDSAAYGTMIHQIFEWMDIKKLKEGKDIDELLTSAAEENPNLKINSAVRKGVRDFYESQLGKALLNSDRIYREQDFLVRMEADEIYPGSNRKETIMVQGIIDCYFFKDDTHVVLIDYKNSGKSEEELKREYASQLAIYRKALQKILGEEIFIESYLWDVFRAKSIPM